MNSIEYRGHTIEIRPFAFSHKGPGVALPSLYDCFVDGLRRSSGFLQAGDAELYGRRIVDEATSLSAPCRNRTYNPVIISSVLARSDMLL